MLARLEDLPQLHLLIGGEVVLEKQLAEPDDRGQRCAKLVAHPRQEVALGPACVLAVLLGSVELIREPPSLGEVARDQMYDALLGREARPPFEPHVASVGIAEAAFEADLLCVAIHQTPQLGGRGVEVVRVDELDDRTTDELIRAMAQQPFPHGRHRVEIAFAVGGGQELVGQLVAGVELSTRALVDVLSPQPHGVRRIQSRAGIRTVVTPRPGAPLGRAPRGACRAAARGRTASRCSRPRRRPIPPCDPHRPNGRSA